MAVQEFPARPAPGSAEIPLCVTETDAAAPEAVCGKAPTMATYRVTPPWGEPDEECAREVFQVHGAQEGVTRSRGPRRSPSWRGARAPIAGAGWFPLCRPAPAHIRQPGRPSGSGTRAAVSSESLRGRRMAPAARIFALSHASTTVCPAFTSATRDWQFSIRSIISTSGASWRSAILRCSGSAESG